MNTKISASASFTDEQSRTVSSNTRQDSGSTETTDSGLRCGELAIVQRIWEHPLYQESLLTIERLERDRIFCGHDRTHLLDVARIACIENLESGSRIPKYLIYAAALLHDIGRHLQYLDGIPHHEGSALLAEKILPECGFSSGDIEQILDAIRSHRNKDMRTASGLSGLIYRADKRSRCCFACPAEAECNWSKEKKNMILTV